MKILFQQKTISRKRILSTIFFTLCLFLITTSVGAQSRALKSSIKANEKDLETFQKLIDNQKQLNKMTRYQYEVAGSYEKKYNRKNGLATEEDYKIPAKVGIMAFYISDNDYSEVSDGWITSYKSTEEKVNVIAQRIFDQSITGMKEQYGLMGMELLTPDEFLTTDELKHTYYNFPLPNLEGKASVFDIEGSGAAVPDGFRLLPYGSVWGLHKFAKEQRDFFMGLDLDAFIIVEIKLVAANGSLNGIISKFYYKNPGFSKSEHSKSDKSVNGYTAYSTANVDMNFKPPMKGIYIKDIVEYTNKKGKADTKLSPVDMNPNLSKLVEHVVVSLGRNSVKQITK